MATKAKATTTETTATKTTTRKEAIEAITRLVLMGIVVAGAIIATVIVNLNLFTAIMDSGNATPWDVALDMIVTAVAVVIVKTITGPIIDTIMIIKNFGEEEC